jgi:hypothetical protein
MNLLEQYAEVYNKQQSLQANYREFVADVRKSNIEDMMQPFVINTFTDFLNEFRSKYPKLKKVNRETPFKEKYFNDNLELITRFRKNITDYQANMFDGQKEYEAKLVELASNPDLTVPISEDAIVVHYLYAGAYASQGFGADRYSLGNLERIAQKYEFYGVKCYIPPLTKDTGSYTVMGYTTEIGVSIVEHKSGLPMREQIKQMLQKGINPKVYNPFLPHDYLEQFKLDAWGKDI